MSAQGKKYYVVWVGYNPGVYDNWDDAQEQIANFPGARYRSFNTPEAAAEAYRSGVVREETLELGRLLSEADEKAGAGRSRHYTSIAEIDKNGWAVDASCLGNPGVMEYRGVDLATGEELFRVGPFQDATNNIGEFLAIVHALALQEKMHVSHTIYSDSVSGMAWVRRREVKTKLAHTPRNAKVFELIGRGLQWLNTHRVATPVLKWHTERWGEIPADFGRK